MDSPGQRRETWSSNAGFIAAAIGSAVGLGNIWRFPYMTGENGGGAFLIAYLVAVLLCGAPLMMFELAAGRKYAGGPYAVFRAMNPKARYIGAGVAVVGFIILSYYIVIAGWTLGHAGLMAVGAEPDFDAFARSWASLGLFIVTVAISIAIVLRGVTKGIEAASTILLPVLVVIVVALAVYGLTFDGRGEALAFLLQPNMGALLEPGVWAAAIGQAFFSLSVGTGILITYGSYLNRATPVRDSVIVVGGADSLIALMAGVAIFPIVFTFGVSPAAGPQLAFEALPRLFGSIAFGQIVGSAFYLLLFVAATTSILSMVEMSAIALAEWRGWPRNRAIVTIAVAFLALGGLCALSYSPVGLTVFDRPLLDVLDSSVGTYGLLMAGLGTCIALFWMGDAKAVAENIGAGARGTAGRAIVIVGRYVVTGALVLTLVAQFWRLF